MLKYILYILTLVTLSACTNPLLVRANDGYTEGGGPRYSADNKSVVELPNWLWGIIILFLLIFIVAFPKIKEWYKATGKKPKSRASSNTNTLLTEEKNNQ